MLIYKIYAKPQLSKSDFCFICHLRVLTVSHHTALIITNIRYYKLMSARILSMVEYYYYTGKFSTSIQNPNQIVML